MSLTVGSSGNLNQAIASVLAQMSGTTAAPAPSSADTGTFPSAPGATNNAITGSGKASYSNDILNLFTQMHQKAGVSGGASSASSSSATTTTIASATTLATPFDTLLSSIDTDNDAMSMSATDADPTESGAADATSWSVYGSAVRPDESSI